MEGERRDTPTESAPPSTPPVELPSSPPPTERSNQPSTGRPPSDAPRGRTPGSGMSGGESRDNRTRTGRPGGGTDQPPSKPGDSTPVENRNAPRSQVDRYIAAREREAERRQTEGKQQHPFGSTPAGRESIRNRTKTIKDIKDSIIDPYRNNRRAEGETPKRAHHKWTK